jgi:hypothetical protein
MVTKVGELAAATGLTVRTLHYHEEIGLLVSSGRTHAGHRVYDDTDVARLYRICLLRRLGLPLAEIGPDRVRTPRPDVRLPSTPLTTSKATSGHS